MQLMEEQIQALEGEHCHQASEVEEAQMLLVVATAEAKVAAAESRCLSADTMIQQLKGRVDDLTAANEKLKGQV
jgi:hypothetical protein